MRLALCLAFALVLLSAFAGGSGAAVGAAPPAAEKILQRMEEVLSAGAREMIQVMEVSDDLGGRQSYRLRVWTEGAERVLVQCLDPAEARGAGLLWADGAFWVYLPAMGRATPLPSALRGVSFLGGDLSYEELGRLSDQRGYCARVVGEEKIGEAACHVLELVPRQAAGPYSRVRLWVEKERFLPRRAEFYQQDGRLWKVLVASFPQRIAGRWVVRRLELENLLERRRTSLEIITLRFRQGFPAAFFTPRTLERGILP